MYTKYTTVTVKGHYSDQIYISVINERKDFKYMYQYPVFYW